MARDRRRKPHVEQEAKPPPELERILRDLDSPDERTRANAVRQLCPCRGTQWEVPVFQRVLTLRNDPSPLVRHAVQHDLEENPDWGERQEARRLERRRQRQEAHAVKREIEQGSAPDGPPPAHSLVWRMPHRPRSRKGYCPRARR